ncbi:coiled-coil domain-containing protein 137 isoform X1 [Neoarius graeffei]|uniref:coiled-coil domain-containing protein 137 isoform X1 n=1 Tax=Neoarius graeffei TaxID=443677 RepID=UPI00298C1A11|nr:coiled-coil domain-containing protein 137 isoform X1 [Neoarius graeffei]
MVKNSRNKASEFYQQQTAEQISSKKVKKDVKPRQEEHLEQIPFRLRAIMKSKEKMNMGSNKLKKITRVYKPKAQTEICEQERIRVPHFRRGKQESETAYLRRMSQETRHVFFLAKNQPERHPERYLEEKAATSNREIKKKEFNKRRWLHKKKVKQQEYVVKDKVQFGEVAMAPPSLSVKPKKAPVKPQRASSSLLRSSILDHTDVSTAAPSLARQKIIGEEHERVVHAYRQLKRQIREQKAGINKYLNAQKRTRKL